MNSLPRVKVGEKSVRGALDLLQGDSQTYRSQDALLHHVKKLEMFISNAICKIPPCFQMNKRKLGTYNSEPQLTRCCCCSKKKAKVDPKFNSASCHTDKGSGGTTQRIILKTRWALRGWRHAPSARSPPTG